MTEKLLLLSDPSLREGIKTAEQDCPALRVLSASVRPRDCGPRAPLPRGFSTGSLCRGCCAVLQGGLPTQGSLLQGLRCTLGGGAPDPGVLSAGAAVHSWGGPPDPGVLSAGAAVRSSREASRPRGPFCRGCGALFGAGLPTGDWTLGPCGCCAARGSTSSHQRALGRLLSGSR